MSHENKVCMELIFKKTSSDNEAAKINDFWNLIDSQDEIQPYDVKNVENPKLSKNKDNGLAREEKSEVNSEESEETLNCGSSNEEKDEKFWYKELQLFKTLGLDKIALSTCKNKNSNGSKNSNENLILSDMVDQTYEEVKIDLENFEKRLENV